MYINWDKELENAEKRDKKIAKLKTEKKEKKKINTYNKKKHSRTLTDDAKKIQEREAAKSPIMRFEQNAFKGMANSSVPGLIYSIASGKKLVDYSGTEMGDMDDKLSSKLGNLAGTMIGYGGKYKAAENLIVKGGAKVVGSKVGQEVSKKMGEKVATGLAKGLVGDATIGTAMNYGLARGEGLEGKDLAKDMAINSALDLGVGGAIELAPLLKGLKKGSKAVDLPVKNVEVKPNVKPIEQAVKTDAPKTSPNVNGLKKDLGADVNKAIKRDEFNSFDTGNKATLARYKKSLNEYKDGTLTTKKKYVEQAVKNGSTPMQVMSSGKHNPTYYIDAEKVSKAEYEYAKHLEKNGFNATIQPKSVDDYIREYGKMDDADLPKATPHGEVSQAARTISNSDMVDDELIKRIRENAEDFTKATKHNKTALDNSVAKIDEAMKSKEGVDGLYSQFTRNVKDGKANASQDIADGYKLAEYYQSTGDYDKAMDVLADTATVASEMGRGLQSMRIFSMLTPEGRLKAVAKTTAKLSGKAGKKIAIPNELLENLKNAVTEGDVARANKAISVNVWNQIPANFTEKVNAWRYLAMLGNPKTHLRNILGNGLFYPVKSLSDGLAAAMEKTLPKEMRVHSLSKDKDVRRLAAKEFADDVDILKGQSKYMETVRDLDAKVWQSKIGVPVEKLREFNANALDTEDSWFMGLAYKRAFEQFCTAKGLKVADITGDILSQAKSYAREEALYSTYRDYSEAAQLLNRLKRNAQVPLSQVNGKNIGTKALKKGGSMIVESIAPFTKTPINILKRGVEYSPLNLMNGAGKIVKSIKNGNVDDALKGIDSLAKGLTGTGILTLGYFLADQGILTGSLPDGKETDFAKNQGEQQYSVNITDPFTGEQYSVTLDWATPISMTLFTGVELKKILEEQGLGGYQLMEVLKQIPEPLLNLSMLSGVENAFDTQFEQGSKVSAILQNTAEGYISQFFPTLLSQIARTSTAETRTTTSTEENTSGRKLERFINRLENKVPGLTDTNEPYVDLWGNTDKKYSAGDYVKAGLENFLSPAYVEKNESTIVNDELNNLAPKLDEETARAILPATVKSYTVKFDGIEYRFTEEELTQFKKTKGQASQSKLLNLFNSNKYSEMSNDEKAKAIKKVYEEAGQKAKQEYLKSKGFSQTDIDFVNLPDSKKQAYGGTGVTKKAFLNVVDKADYDNNGYYKKDELVQYLNTKDWKRSTKAKVFRALANWNAHNPYE